MTLIFSQSKLSASKWKHKHLDSAAEVTIWGVTGGGGEICAGILNLPGKIFITNTRDKRAVAPSKRWRWCLYSPEAFRGKPHSSSRHHSNEIKKATLEKRSPAKAIFCE
ncbi:hypothetical protein RP20_CCG022459 [Aedes albopictus]|nr:hypothetical protein RP20_CCG022459 [Aedes albopictus]